MKKSVRLRYAECVFCGKLKMIRNAIPLGSLDIRDGCFKLTFGEDVYRLASDDYLLEMNRENIFQFKEARTAIYLKHALLGHFFARCRRAFA